ncbi:hypothetical protein RG959_17230 [Domibacillus sp. 8LH]|uniref:hypothetical protein n=1 Tax=Domibacillus TaxID=1433999 RepID=UPI001F59CF93|nr:MULTISPECIES: hypothetical protein [Domibacillus]MCI2252902.1 hypothetical protein [Domibacillus sp. PGB-M46]MCM3787321.1 hypothetical protein [Domibacillus indicus]WNS81394.1 hypothetical protein RRU94_11380 [Domibacillus sp. DTU_2020_1001157_1_SI_ALB_TIR_016]
MSRAHFYHLCSQHTGKKVKITCRDGKVHTGRITRVTRDHVWIRPAGFLGGFGYGFYGWYGYGYGYPVALAAIAGFALASAFFLW